MSNPYLEAALRQQGAYVPTDYGQELLSAIKANPDAFRGRGLMNWRSSDGLGIMDIPAEARAIGDAYLGSDEYRSSVTQPTPQAPPRGANTAPAPAPAPAPRAKATTSTLPPSLINEDISFDDVDALRGENIDLGEVESLINSANVDSGFSIPAGGGLGVDDAFGLLSEEDQVIENLRNQGTDEASLDSIINANTDSGFGIPANGPPTITLPDGNELQLPDASTYMDDPMQFDLGLGDVNIDLNEASHLVAGNPDLQLERYRQLTGNPNATWADFQAEDARIRTEIRDKEEARMDWGDYHPSTLIPDVLGRVGSGIKDAVTGIPDFVEDVGKGWGSQIKEDVGDAYHALPDVSDVTDEIGTAWDAWRDVGSQGLDALESGVGAVGSGLGALGETALDLAPNWDDWRNLGGDISSGIGSGAGALADAVGAVGNAIVNPIDTLKTAGDIAGNVGRAYWDEASGMVGDAKDALGNVGRAYWDEASQMAGDAKDALVNTVRSGAGVVDDLVGKSTMSPEDIERQQQASMGGGIGGGVANNVIAPTQPVDPSIYQDAVFDQPILDMPEIIDYSEMMRAPLIDRVMGALDAPNPYDTRRDAMLRGPTNQIQRNWEQANENLMNRFGVMGMDTPALYAQARKLDEAKALQMDNLESQWAGLAAGQDENIRRNRLNDATQMMGGDYARVRDEMAYQGGLQDTANAGMQNFMAGSQAGMGDALSYDDSGLNMAVGAGGGYVAPNMGAASTGLANVAQQAGQNLQNQPDWSGVTTNLYNAFNKPNNQNQNQNQNQNPTRWEETNNKGKSGTYGNVYNI